jgi:hypothetical protein
MKSVDPLEWFREDFYWSVLNDAPAGTRVDNRDAL